MPEPTAAEMRDALLEMLENLEGYIRREAGKAAGPLIEQAQEEANAAIRAAQREVERKQDVVEELGRRLGALERQREQALTASHRIAVALGRNPERAYPGFGAVAGEVERRIAEDAATIERLRSQVLGATMAGQMDEVQLPEYPEASHA